jgi:hypothetical protein
LTACGFDKQIHAGDPATTVTLTITTTGPNTGTVSPRRADNRGPWLPLTLPLAGVLIMGTVGRRVSRHSARAGLCVSLLLLGLLIACGGGGSSGPPPPPAVTVSPNPASVSLGATKQFSSNTSGVTWSLTGAGAVGAIDNTGLYTAPAMGTTPVSFSVTATAPDARTGAATLNINKVGVTVGQGTPPSIFPNHAGWPAQTAQFAATVSNAGNTAVTWAVTGGNANGTIDANGLYTAPTLAPGLPATATLTATSQADVSQSGSNTETLSTPTALGTYTVTVTATEGAVSHSQNVTLTVQ